MVRVFVNGEDFGTMADTKAQQFKAVSEEYHPEDIVTMEPVADDAPTFLSDLEDDSSASGSLSQSE